MDDPGVGRDDLEVVERPLAPAQERVALLVSLELELGVALRTPRGVPNASTCTEWSMTSSAGTSGLILFGSPPISAIASRIAARSTIAGTPVKSCITTRAGVKAISLDGLGAGVPARQRLDVLGPDRLAVLVAEQVLEQDLQRERQPGDVELGLEGVEAKDLVRAVADSERRPGIKAVSVTCSISWFQRQYSYSRLDPGGRPAPTFVLPRSSRKLRSGADAESATRIADSHWSPSDNPVSHRRRPDPRPSDTLFAAAVYTEAHRAPDQS